MSDLGSRDLLALQAFELAARSGSFKAAAEALHITASAVSHRIAGLEKTLGERLFERGPRGVTLSATGRLLASTTGRAFGDLARALARQGAGSQRLRVSAVPIFATHWLLPRLGQFLAAHPNIDLPSWTGGEPLPGGDFPMTGFEALVHDLGIDYPWAEPALVRRLRLRRAADVLTAPLVRVSPFGASWPGWAEGAGLDPAPFERQQGLQVDGMGAALRAASHGLGVALAFDPLIDSEIASGALVQVGPKVPARGQVWFVCRPREKNLPAIRALRRWLLVELNPTQG